MVKLNDIREGSIVTVRGNFGNGPATRAKVDYVDSNIKNGQPGIDYTDLNSGDKHWAYLGQIDSVVTH